MGGQEKREKPEGKADLGTITCLGQQPLLNAQGQEITDGNS